MSQEQIGSPIAVEVPPCGRPHAGLGRQAPCRGHIPEAGILVPIEAMGAGGEAHEEVQAPVAVKIGPRIDQGTAT
jgi:hypothetical protein